MPAAEESRDEDAKRRAESLVQRASSDAQELADSATGATAAAKAGSGFGWDGDLRFLEAVANGGEISPDKSWLYIVRGLKHPVTIDISPSRSPPLRLFEHSNHASASSALERRPVPLLRSAGRGESRFDEFVALLHHHSRRPALLSWISCIFRCMDCKDASGRPVGGGMSCNCRSFLFLPTASDGSPAFLAEALPSRNLALLLRVSTRAVSSCAASEEASETARPPPPSREEGVTPRASWEASVLSLREAPKRTPAAAKEGRDRDSALDKTPSVAAAAAAPSASASASCNRKIKEFVGWTAVSLVHRASASASAWCVGGIVFGGQRRDSIGHWSASQDLYFLHPPKTPPPSLPSEVAPSNSMPWSWSVQTAQGAAAELCRSAAAAASLRLSSTVEFLFVHGGVRLCKPPNNALRVEVVDSLAVLRVGVVTREKKASSGLRGEEGGAQPLGVHFEAVKVDMQGTVFPPPRYGHSIAVRRHSDRHLSLFCVGGLGERNEALSDVWELQAQLREGPSLTLLCAWRKLPLPQVEPQTGNQSPSQRLLPFLWMPLQPSILVLEVSRRRRPGLPASASQESARRKTDFRVAVGDAPSGSAESEVSSEVGDVSLLPHQQQRRRLLLFVIGGCRNTGVFASLGDAALAPKSQMLSQRGAFISRFERTDWGRCGCALYELRPSLPAAVAQKLSDRQRVVSPPPVSAGRQTHSHSTHQKLQTQTEAEFQAQTQTQSQSELQLQRHSQQESNRKEGGGGEAASGEEDSCNKKLLEGKASLINQLREKMKRKGLGLSGKATVEDELRSNNTNNFTNNNNGVQQSSAAVPVRAESLNAAAKQGAEDAASLTNASSARGVAGEDSAAPEPRPLIALLQLQQQLAKARLLTQQHQDANSRETPPQETEHSEGAAAVGSFSASGNPRSPAEGALLPSSPGDSGEGAGHSPPGRVSFRLNARPLDARVQTQIRQCRAALERDLEEGEEIELPLELRRLILKAQRWGAEGSGSFSSSPSNRPRQNAAAANAGASEGLSTEANATLAAAPQVQAIDALCPTQEQLQQQPHRHTAQPVRQEGRRQDQAALGEAPPASLSPPPESLLLALPAPPSRGFGLHWGVSSKGAADSFSQKRRLSDAAAMWEGGAETAASEAAFASGNSRQTSLDWQISRRPLQEGASAASVQAQLSVLRGSGPLSLQPQSPSTESQRFLRRVRERAFVDLAEGLLGRLARKEGLDTNAVLSACAKRWATASRKSLTCGGERPRRSSSSSGSDAFSSEGARRRASPRRNFPVKKRSSLRTRRRRRPSSWEPRKRRRRSGGRGEGLSRRRRRSSRSSSCSQSSDWQEDDSVESSGEDSQTSSLEGRPRASRRRRSLSPSSDEDSCVEGRTGRRGTRRRRRRARRRQSPPLSDSRDRRWRRRGQRTRRCRRRGSSRSESEESRASLESASRRLLRGSSRSRRLARGKDRVTRVEERVSRIAETLRHRLGVALEGRSRRRSRSSSSRIRRSRPCRRTRSSTESPHNPRARLRNSSLSRTTDDGHSSQNSLPRLSRRSCGGRRGAVSASDPPSPSLPSAENSASEGGDAERRRSFLRPTRVESVASGSEEAFSVAPSDKASLQTLDGSGPVSAAASFANLERVRANCRRRQLQAQGGGGGGLTTRTQELAFDALSFTPNKALPQNDAALAGGEGLRRNGAFRPHAFADASFFTAHRGVGGGGKVREEELVGAEEPPSWSSQLASHSAQPWTARLRRPFSEDNGRWRGLGQTLQRRPSPPNFAQTTRASRSASWNFPASETRTQNPLQQQQPPLPREALTSSLAATPPVPLSFPSVSESAAADFVPGVDCMLARYDALVQNGLLDLERQFVEEQKQLARSCFARQTAGAGGDGQEGEDGGTFAASVGEALQDPDSHRSLQHQLLPLQRTDEGEEALFSLPPDEDRRTSRAQRRRLSRREGDLEEGEILPSNSSGAEAVAELSSLSSLEDSQLPPDAATEEASLEMLAGNGGEEAGGRRIRDEEAAGACGAKTKKAAVEETETETPVPADVAGREGGEREASREESFSEEADLLLMPQPQRPTGFLRSLQSLKERVGRDLLGH